MLSKFRSGRLILLMLMGLVAIVIAACSAPPAEEEAAEEEPEAEEAEADEEMEEEMDEEMDEEMAEEGEEVAAADSDIFCGDPELLADELFIFNWSEYMDPEILTQFEEDCGVSVTEDVFSSNEDMIARIQAGNSGYSLVFPSDYAVALMADDGLLAELNKDNIPNIENLNPELMGEYFDPENTYSMPYQWGTTGIAYNTAFFDEPPTSSSILFESDLLCENSGFVSVLDDERETVGAALIYLGYDPNETSPEAHAEAEELLIAQKECLAGYNSDNFNQTLASEEVVLALAWSGGVALATDENPNVNYVIPEEGGVIWMDNMAIPADAPEQYTAEIFINYILDAQIGAQLSNWTYYFTPNAAAEPLLDEYYFDLLESGGMAVDAETLERLTWLERNEETVIFSDTWTAVKAR